MKYQTTLKKARARYPKIINLGNCDAQNLLSTIEPSAFTAGSYGWNADIYHVSGDIAIAIGPRAFGNITPDHAITRRYDELARSNPGKIDKLLQDFANEICG